MSAGGRLGPLLPLQRVSVGRRLHRPVGQRSHGDCPPICSDYVPNFSYDYL
jgi:hypothetical protein